MLAYDNTSDSRNSWPFVSIIAMATLTLFSIPTPARSQHIEQAAAYVSRTDSEMTIRRITVLPVSDNVDGIYARPIEAHLVSLVKSSHRWDFVEPRPELASNGISIASLEEDPTKLQALAQSSQVDAALAATVSRGPKGISIRLFLFLKHDGQVISQESLRDHSRFEISDILDQVKQMYGRMISRLPYRGLVLSRQNNMVTLNLGQSDGVMKDQVVTAIQIISVVRHPRFHFLISSEKEILGQIKILKVDETLSFGAIISEKEKGAIQKETKISSLESISYPEPDSLNSIDAAASGNLEERSDSEIIFGKNPKEWLPVRAPSFGQVGLNVGLGTYHSSVNLNSVGTLEARSSFAPSLTINGELWLNPNWIVKAELSQGIISTDNPRSGSKPDSLNHSSSRYMLAIGYNILLRDDFFGPKFQLGAGFTSYRMFVDDSQPQSLTTTTYSGFLLSLSGSFPIDKDSLWTLGGQLSLYVSPTLAESPVSSGSDAKNTINDFSLLVSRKIAENILATGSVELSLYSTSFGGSGGNRTGPNGPESATSISQRHTRATGGIVYMF